MRHVLPLRVRVVWGLLLAAVLGVSVGAAGCASPVSVEPASVEDVYSSLVDFSLNSGGMSDDTRVSLERANLREAFEEDPRKAVGAMHGLALRGDFRERLAALAEMSYVAGERTGDRRCFLASAVYAHFFLFGREPGAAGDDLPGKFRRRTRRAADLYNVGVARAFSEAADDGVGLFVPEAGRVELPAGTVDVALPALPLHVEGFAYDELRPAIGMKITGFRNRDVSSGLGAPLVGRRRAVEGARERKAHLAPTSALAVTAFLRIDGEFADMAEPGRGLRAALEFHRPTGARKVVVNGHDVPLEFDMTAALAWELNESRPWEKEITGFLDKDDADVDNAVFLTEPYVPGRIPVLFVHGTASSPARWAEILNELHADGRVNANCQFWIYQYGSGAPILVSAAGLRYQIDRTVRDLDPEGKDPALRQMVVVGHSQGGLLTRLQATSGGDRFWNYVSDVPFDELGLSDSEKRYWRPVFFFEPSPYVRRCVFLATPHRGSYVAGNWIGQIGASLVALPKAVTRGAGRLAKRALGAGAGIRTENLSTAVDDMSPGSPFLTALDASPRAEDVPFHSIVAVLGLDSLRGDDALMADGADGVVRFESAHLPDAASERRVNVDHSCQNHPATVAEIRRIIREHLDSVGR